MLQYFNLIPDNNLESWPPKGVKDDASNTVIMSDLLTSGEE